MGLFGYHFGSLVPLGPEFGTLSVPLHSIRPQEPEATLESHVHELNCIAWCDIREGFKNPRHGNFPLGGGTPRASTDEIFPKFFSANFSENSRPWRPRGGVPPQRKVSVPGVFEAFPDDNCKSIQNLGVRSNPL